MTLSACPPPPPALRGTELLDEILELLIAKVPLLADDDPARPELAAVIPELSGAMGRPFRLVT